MGPRGHIVPWALPCSVKPVVPCLEDKCCCYLKITIIIVIITVIIN